MLYLKIAALRSTAINKLLWRTSENFLQISEMEKTNKVCCCEYKKKKKKYIINSFFCTYLQSSDVSVNISE